MCKSSLEQMSSGGISNQMLTYLSKIPHWQDLHIFSSPQTSLKRSMLHTKRREWTLGHLILKNTLDFKALELNKTGCMSIYRWMRQDHRVVNSRCPLQSGLHPPLHISACHMLALRAHYQKEGKKKTKTFTWSSLRLRTIYCIP